MADLIALLLASLAGFFQGGADHASMAETIKAAVMETQPIPVAAVDVEFEQQQKTASLHDIVFTLDDATLDPLEVDETVIRVNGIRSTDDGSITFGGLDWTAKITDDALTAALRQHVKSLSDAQVRAAGKTITLTGTYPVWPLRVPYSVDGSLVVENQTELVFHVSRTGLSGLNLPAALNRLIESEINPVYDLAQFASRSKKDLDNARAKLDYKFMLNIEKITVGEGYLLVKGDA